MLSLYIGTFILGHDEHSLVDQALRKQQEERDKWQKEQKEIEKVPSCVHSSMYPLRVPFCGIDWAVCLARNERRVLSPNVSIGISS